MRRIDLIVVHCSATRAHVDIGAATIDRWHREMGWSGIGYHWVIRRDGTVEPGRPVAMAGSHAKGFNARSIGICLIGGVDDLNRPENNFTPAQFDALERELRTNFAARPMAQLCGHRDLSPDLNGDGRISPNEWVKACPSFDVRSWWEARSARTLAPLVLV